VANLTGYPAIDVAIGLVVMFIVLSVVCSAIQEFFAMVFSRRARFLEKALKELLGDEKATEVRDRIPGDPSYIDARQFSLALLDTLAPDADRPGLLAAAETSAEAITNPAAKRPVLRMIQGAEGNVDKARVEIEAWFDAAMDRVSGWYKRRVQYWLLVIAILVVGVSNADTFHVANKLWSDPTLRAALVQESDQILQSGPTGPSGPSASSGVTGAQGALAPATTEPCPDSQKDTPSAKKCVESKLQNIATSVDDVKQLKLPIGWTKDNTPDKFVSWGTLGKLFGLLITVAALSLGAPFWFDVLGKLSRLRATGAKPAGSDTSTNEPKTA
jgi:hypothetical protein